MPLNTTVPEPARADLSPALPFREYVALTSVEPFAHHYVVSYEGAADALPMIAARHDAEGTLRLSEGGNLGQSLRPPPAELEGVTRAVEGELARRCPGTGFRLSYAGSFRRLRVTRFSPTDLQPGSERMGWFSTTELLADAKLENAVPAGYHHSKVVVYSGYGPIHVPENVRWVELEREGASFESRVLAAARGRELGAPGPRLAELAAAESDALIAAGQPANVHLVVNFGTASAEPARAILTLNVRDAVFGPEASSETEVKLGASSYKVQATLVPEEPLPSEPSRAQREYRGHLTFRIYDARGAAFERTYPTTGDVILKGEEAAVPYAWLIPGSTIPSPEDQLRRGTLPGAGGKTAEFSLDTQLKVRPPR